MELAVEEYEEEEQLEEMEEEERDETTDYVTQLASLYTMEEEEEDEEEDAEKEVVELDDGTCQTEQAVRDKVMDANVPAASSDAASRVERCTINRFSDEYIGTDIEVQALDSTDNQQKIGRHEIVSRLPSEVEQDVATPSPDHAHDEMPSEGLSYAIVDSQVSSLQEPMPIVADWRRTSVSMQRVPAPRRSAMDAAASADSAKPKSHMQQRVPVAKSSQIVSQPVVVPPLKPPPPPSAPPLHQADSRLPQASAVGPEVVLPQRAVSEASQAQLESDTSSLKVSALNPQQENASASMAPRSPMGCVATTPPPPPPPPPPLRMANNDWCLQQRQHLNMQPALPPFCPPLATGFVGVSSLQYHIPSQGMAHSALFLGQYAAVQSPPVIHGAHVLNGVVPGLASQPLHTPTALQHEGPASLRERALAWKAKAASLATPASPLRETERHMDLRDAERHTGLNVPKDQTGINAAVETVSEQASREDAHDTVQSFSRARSGKAPDYSYVVALAAAFAEGGMSGSDADDDDEAVDKSNLSSKRRCLDSGDAPANALTSRATEEVARPPPPPDLGPQLPDASRYGWLPPKTRCRRCRKAVVSRGGVFCGRRRLGPSGHEVIVGCGAAVCWRCMNRAPHEELGKIRTTNAEFESLGDDAWWLHEFCMDPEDRRDYYSAGDDAEPCRTLPGTDVAHPKSDTAADANSCSGRFEWE
eukprot:TRINITY_DN5758_c1_g4_i1.p1 TRINITY_DN5758_c1_g4~~TRINITY_DN5758_c1_g4_i1.p1  ORF type:complete len:704 (-),score=91.19 TRINITY_DN5758_c1_g4_i1:140-2251(-)